MRCGLLSEGENLEEDYRGKDFLLMPSGFMSIKSPKTLPGKPGFVFSIQCQDLRIKLLKVVGNSPSDDSHSQHCLKELSVMMQMFYVLSGMQPLATCGHWALKLLLVWMMNSIFNLLNLNLDFNNHMWLLAITVDTAGLPFLVVLNQSSV